MEITENNWKEKNKQQQQALIMQQQMALSKQRSLPPSLPCACKNKTIDNDQKKKKKSLQLEELKLAAIAVSLKVRLKSADMPISMQERAIRCGRSLLDASSSSTSGNHHRPSPTVLARSIKREFDSLYGPAWHCVVGKSFGSFVTHSPGGFVYFSLDSLSFLLFKTEVHLIKN